MQNSYSQGGHSFQQSIDDASAHEMVSNTSKLLFMNNDLDSAGTVPTTAILSRTPTSSPSKLLPRTTVSASSATKSLLLSSATSSLMASGLMHNSIVNPCLLSSSGTQYSTNHYSQPGHHYPSQHSFAHNPSLYLDHTFYSSHYSNSFYSTNSSQIDAQYQQTYSSMACTDVQPTQSNPGTMMDLYEPSQTSPTQTILSNTATSSSVRATIQQPIQPIQTSSASNITGKISNETQPTSANIINHKHKHISVRLMDMDIWRRFFNVNNEMIVTKGGR